MSSKWAQFKRKAMAYKKCHNSGLSSQGSFPLFMKFEPKEFNILFVLEAPNRDDTYDPNKGYLTYLEDTDPTGNFFSELFLDILEFKPNQLFVSNSVLCLPSKINGKYLVKTQQILNCSSLLAEMMNEFSPKIVCAVGGKALEALKRVHPHELKLRGSVGRPEKWYNRWIFPLYHTSRLGRANREESLQKRDWLALRNFYDDIK